MRASLPRAAASCSVALPPRVACRRASRASPRTVPARRASFACRASAAGVPASADVVVVGAGVAGLACARELRRAGCDVLVVEASDGVGGRVRTDVHPEGFLLDRGFHIYLTSYPEAVRALDEAQLELSPFYAGALVRFGGAWHRVADPVRHLGDALASLLPDNAVGDAADKLRVGLLRCATLSSGLRARADASPPRVVSLLSSPYAFLTAPETTTMARLQQARVVPCPSPHALSRHCSCPLHATAWLLAGHDRPLLAPLPGRNILRLGAERV